MKAKCPKCGWETRELEPAEVQYVKEGRLRCSGKCQEGASPNAPSSYPPVLVMAGDAAGAAKEETNGGN